MLKPAGYRAVIFDDEHAEWCLAAPSRPGFRWPERVGVLLTHLLHLRPHVPKCGEDVAVELRAVACLHELERRIRCLLRR